MKKGILLALIAVILTSSGYILYSLEKGRNSDSSKPLQGSSLVYENDALGFCFEYPDTVSVEPKTNDQGLFTISLKAPSFAGDPYPNQPFNKEMIISFDHIATTSLRGYIADKYVPDDISGIVDRTINSLPALEVSSVSPHAGDPQKVVYVLFGSLVMSAHYYTGEPGTPYKNIFANIIETIKQKKTGEACQL